MYLYTGSTEQFVEDAVQNRIAEKLKVSFFQQLHYNPSPSEVNSWRNSLRALCNALTHAQLLDVGVVLEWQLPLTSMRLDCLLTGKAEDSSAHAVIVELKQWDEAGLSSVEDCVVTYLGGRLRDVLHEMKARFDMPSAGS